MESISFKCVYLHFKWIKAKLFYYLYYIFLGLLCLIYLPNKETFILGVSPFFLDDVSKPCFSIPSNQNGL